MNGKQCKLLRGRNPGRASYRRAKKAHTHGPTTLAQQATLVEPRQRRHPKAISATWPGTKDQRAQSRPVITVRRYLPGQNRKALA